MNPSHMKKTRIAALVVSCFGSQYALAASISYAPITSYVGDPGKVGDPASWRTPEFLRDWGMRAIGAEYAYAAGVAGSGVAVGVVDSGYREIHPEFMATPSTPLRFNSVTASGGTTGPTPGFWNSTYNDSHGTHVSGTVGANRDGGSDPANMQGVAFNATIYEGNTHKTDGAVYGRLTNASATNTPDKDYISNLYKAVNTAGTAASPVRIITSSWGSAPSGESYTTLAGLTSGWNFLASPAGNGPYTSWIQGAIDVAKTGTIIQFTAGNGGFANPTPRGAATYFMPSLEGHWYTTSAISTVGQTFNADGSINVPGTQNFNQCGVAKWACVTAPGNQINSALVRADGTVGYQSISGTSMAGPHSAAALSLIMERFPYLTNEQALDVMFTTAVQNNTINNASGVAVINPTAGQIVAAPDSRNGWGTVNLKNAMQGPGQFLGVFQVDTQGYDDTWSLNISDVAIKQRKVEDAVEAATWTATKAANGWTGLIAPPAGSTDAQISDFTTGMAREAARNSRVYEGSLIKNGAGMLTLSGNNTFTGGVTIASPSGGGLVATSAHALGSGNVTVQSGTLATRSATAVQIDGDLTMQPLGVLDLGVNFNTGVALNVAGHGSLTGGLMISLMDDLTQGILASGVYDVIDFGSYDGTFSSFSITGLGDFHYMANLLYNARGVELAFAVPEPETGWLLLPTLGLLFVLRRRKRVDD